MFVMFLTRRLYRWVNTAQIVSLSVYLLHSGVFKSESRELVDKETILTFSDVLYMCKKYQSLFYFEIVLYIQEHF